MSELSKAEKIRDGLHLLLSVGQVDVDAQHDEFFAGVAIYDPPDPPDSIKAMIARKMEKLGWREGEDFGWVIFT